MLFHAPCRLCGARLQDVVCDLGVSPLCESYLPAYRLNVMEPFYPLKVWVCRECWLVQLEEYVGAEHIYSEYAYFSSYSDSWVEHAKQYAGTMAAALGLDAGSLVVEIASNDGYLLQHFVPLGVPVLGIEPAMNVARAAEARGVPTRVAFFGEHLARGLSSSGVKADLLVANNVFGHVPNLLDFLRGLPLMLKPGGVLTVEIPQFRNLLRENQFDTIYHEHYQYWSFRALRRALEQHGLAVFDVEELPTHGGSMRVYAALADGTPRPVDPRVEAMEALEERDGVRDLATYTAFEQRVRDTKRALLSLLIRLKGERARIAGYGAPGKGNTLLNYCGIGRDFLDFTVDRNPYKQGKYLPGTRIPIRDPEEIRRRKPSHVLILPWNLEDEIRQQIGYIREWGGKFIVPIPEPRIEP